MEWVLHVNASACWIDGISSELPPLTVLDAMQRRRLSALAKASLSVMVDCAPDVPHYPVIFASQHGELARTTELLHQLARGEEVSPMGFSLAVLNAIPGVFSIARSNHGACSAISAGEQTLAMGLLEAALQAPHTAEPLLFVHADAPVPAIYNASAHYPDTPLHAIALRLHSQASPDCVSLRCAYEPDADTPASTESLSLTFATHWLQQNNGYWVGAGHRFSWSRL